MFTLHTQRPFDRRENTEEKSLIKVGWSGVIAQSELPTSVILRWRLLSSSQIYAQVRTLDHIWSLFIVIRDNSIYSAFQKDVKVIKCKNFPLEYIWQRVEPPGYQSYPLVREMYRFYWQSQELNGLSWSLITVTVIWWSDIVDTIRISIHTV